MGYSNSFCQQLRSRVVANSEISIREYQNDPTARSMMVTSDVVFSRQRFGLTSLHQDELIKILVHKLFDT